MYFGVLFLKHVLKLNCYIFVGFYFQKGTRGETYVDVEFLMLKCFMFGGFGLLKVWEV